MQVWVNLGISYGWWPGEFNEVVKDKSSKPIPEVEFSKKSDTVGLKCNNESDTKLMMQAKEPIGLVHFFDDDKFDNVRIFDQEMIKSYSCDSKKEYIEAGLAKFSAGITPKDTSVKSKRTSELYRARQAHFYKDVEMAEVMTDNNPDIANILAQYEIVENGDLDEPEVEKEPPKKKRRRKRN